VKFRFEASIPSKADRRQGRKRSPGRRELGSTHRMQKTEAMDKDCSFLFCLTHKEKCNKVFAQKQGFLSLHPTY